MKNLLSLIILLSAVCIGHAQNVKYGGWNQQIVAGAHVSLNSTWIFNSAVQSLDEGISDQGFTFGFEVGGSFEYRFNELIAVALDLQYFSANQNYEGALQTQGQFWESTVSVNGLNIPLYAKLMGKSGVFLEAGFQFGFILGSHYNRFSSVGAADDEVDVSEHFGTVVLSPHLGFGFDFPVNDALMITAGIRANYGVNDIKGVDGLGNPVVKYPDTNAGNPSLSPVDTQPAPSNLFTAGLFIGARYAFDAGGRY
jgi:hypothetical protein